MFFLLTSFQLSHQIRMQRRLCLPEWSYNHGSDLSQQRLVVSRGGLHRQFSQTQEKTYPHRTGKNAHILFQNCKTATRPRPRSSPMTRTPSSIHQRFTVKRSLVGPGWPSTVLGRRRTHSTRAWRTWPMSALPAGNWSLLLGWRDRPASTSLYVWQGQLKQWRKIGWAPIGRQSITEMITRFRRTVP